jgi:hypothetical protein
MINITENLQISESLKIKLMKKCNASMSQPLDVFLNGHQIIENFLFIKKNFSINFFYPNVLIDSPEIYKHDSTSDTAIMIPILIHSHLSNHLRRKAIRDTWLSVSTLHIRDILHSVTDATLTRILNLNKEKIHFPHIFIIGNSNQRQNQSYSKIKKEANLYNDIVMVDLDDQYKNILYKHLTIYDWLMKNCHQLSYFIKMDDDVFVNLKRLSKHLIVNFGLENSMKISKPFIFCNTVG